MRQPQPRAKHLRKAMPQTKRKLWARIRAKQLDGSRFRRQHTIGPYIADFACIEARLAFECDRNQHGRDGGARDARRDAFIEREGWQVLRFWNNEIHANMEGVLETILDAARNAAAFAKPPTDDGCDWLPPLMGEEEGRCRIP